MNICLFTQEEYEAGCLPINDERAQHIVKILHKQKGDYFDAGLIGGMAGTALITAISEQDGIHFSFCPQTDGKALFPLTMIIGFPRPIQLKRLLRDMAGLGVRAVHLTGTELGEKSYMQSTLVERGAAYKMLLDGTMQAKSTHIPELHVHHNLTECLDSLQMAGSFCAALDNVRPQSSLARYIANYPQIKNSFAYAAIGSERGWTDKERALLTDCGFTLCSMGKRVLRTESAATVAAAVILNSMGYLE